MPLTFSICPPSIRELRPNGYYEYVDIIGGKVLVGLIEKERPSLMEDNDFEHLVLVEKIAFSCNYRDKVLMLQMYNSCQRKTRGGLIVHSGFGSDFVGRIIEKGKKVKSLYVGDRVIPDSTYPIRKNGLVGGIPTNYASERFQRFHPSQLIKINSQIPDDVAASITVGAHTVYSMIRKLNLKRGMKVLITAASSNTSLFTIQVLRKMNLDISVVTTNPYFIQHAKHWNIRIISEITKPISMQLFGSDFRGFDVVVDPLFDIYLDKVIHLLKNGGKYITCGLFNQFDHEKVESNELKVQDIISHCIINNISIIGNCLGSHNDINRFLREFELETPSIIIDSVYNGNEIREFIDRSFNSKLRFGKVVYKY